MLKFEKSGINQAEPVNVFRQNDRNPVRILDMVAHWIDQYINMKDNFFKPRYGRFKVAIWYRDWAWHPGLEVRFKIA